MGALFHVNAIWLYGPYDAGSATSYSRPDWYIGFLEGSLRLFPPWEIHIVGYMINNLVFSAMLVPGVIFTGLLGVPWIERPLHEGRRRAPPPRPAPRRARTAPPPAPAPSFVAVLFLGGSQDIIAGTLQHRRSATSPRACRCRASSPRRSCTSRRTGICRALPTRPGPDRTERAGGIVRDAGGGYHEATERRGGAGASPPALGSGVGE